MLGSNSFVAPKRARSSSTLIANTARSSNSRAERLTENASVVDKQDVDDDEGEAASKRRSLGLTKEQEVDEKYRLIMKDNFKGWGTDRTELWFVNGDNLKTTILRDLWRKEDGEKFPMGKIYYANLRVVFFM